ncbi:MAG: hypothetical protein ACNYPD_04940 [Candidatus Halichondribacter symbioticus]
MSNKTPEDTAKGSAENDADAAIRMLANDLHRLNQSVIRAVDAGLSVELIRSSRHHCGEGNWGDLLVPVITRKV